MREHSCDCGISVLNYCIEWDKFVNTHLSHLHIYSRMMNDKQVRSEKGGGGISPRTLGTLIVDAPPVVASLTDNTASVTAAI